MFLAYHNHYYHCNDHNNKDDDTSCWNRWRSDNHIIRCERRRWRRRRRRWRQRERGWHDSAVFWGNAIIRVHRMTEQLNWLKDTYQTFFVSHWQYCWFTLGLLFLNDYRHSGTWLKQFDKWQLKGEKFTSNYDFQPSVKEVCKFSDFWKSDWKCNSSHASLRWSAMCNNYL